MVAARARELLVRKVSARPWPRRSASTSAAPGTSTSPVHTQPSRSKMKPRISRSPRRAGVTAASYHAPRTAGAGRGGPAKIRWPEGFDALDSIYGQEWEGADVYLASGLVRRLLHDLHPPPPALRVYPVRPRRASPERRPDRPRLRARHVADRLLYLLRHDLPALRHPPRSRRSRGSARAAGDAGRHRGDSGGRAHAGDGGAGGAQKHGARPPAKPLRGGKS